MTAGRRTPGTERNRPSTDASEASAKSVPFTDAFAALDAGRAWRAIDLTRAQLRDEEALNRLAPESPTEAVRHYLATLVVTLMAQGLRLGEVLALSSTDIDPDSSIIRVDRTSTRNGTATLPKTGGRTVDLGHRCANVMAPYLAPITDDSVSLDIVPASAAESYTAMTDGLVLCTAVNAVNRQHTGQLPLISLHQLRLTTGR